MFKKEYSFTVDTWNEYVLGRIAGAVNALCGVDSFLMKHHTECFRTTMISIRTTRFRYQLLKRCIRKHYYPNCVIRFLD